MTAVPINYYRSPLPATLVSSTIPAEALKLLGHALNRQQIPGWKFQLSEMCKTLGMTIYAVKEARKWLLKHGYATYKRIKFRFTVWQYFPEPIAQETAHSPRIIERVEIPTVLQVEIQPALEVKELLEVKEQQHEPALIDQQKAVVVFLKEEKQVEAVIIPSLVSPGLIEEDQAGLEYPVQLNQDQKKAAKSQIKKAPIDLQQAILACLAHYMIQGTVKNPVGYLKTLVAAANNGTFEVLGVTEPPKRYSPDNDPKQAEIAARRAWTSSKPEVAKVGIAGLRAGLKGAL